MSSKKEFVCIVKIDGKDSQRSHLIKGPTFVIGRAPEAGLPVLEPSVSRAHAHVELKGETVTLIDQKSANGTHVNDRQLKPGESVALMFDDKVRFGTSSSEYSFLSIPKPYELLKDDDSKKESAMASLSTVAAEIEAREKEKFAAQTKEARVELEQLLAQAQKEVEILKSNALLENQKHREEFERETERIRKEAAEQASEEIAKARMDADRLIAEAQKAVQKDLSDAKERGQQAVSEAEAKATAIVAKAREDAAKLRRDAVDDAGEIHQESLKRAQAAADKLALGRKKEFEDEIAATERRQAALRAEVDSLMAEKSKLRAESDELRDELKAARKLFADVESLEARLAKADRELKERLDMDTAKFELGALELQSAAAPVTAREKVPPPVFTKTSEAPAIVERLKPSSPPDLPAPAAPIPAPSIPEHAPADEDEPVSAIQRRSRFKRFKLAMAMAMAMAMAVAVITAAVLYSYRSKIHAYVTQSGFESFASKMIPDRKPGK